MGFVDWSIDSSRPCATIASFTPEDAAQEINRQFLVTITTGGTVTSEAVTFAWGDGQADTVATEGNYDLWGAFHTYNDAGNYMVTVTAVLNGSFTFVSYFFVDIV